MGHRGHRSQGPAVVACAILTISDSRDRATDTSGAYIRRALERAGHAVVDSTILKDEPRLIVASLEALAEKAEARVVLLTGGTGIGSRDSTFEAVAGLLEKRLDGFGELFRVLSYRSVGSAAMLSRALAGTYRGMVLFSMPGSEAAVRLAMTRLILPELSHVAGLVGSKASGKRHD
jgi:molybdopterin adenylyltransferase